MGKTIVLFNPALTLKKKNYSKFFNIQESQKQLEDVNHPALKCEACGEIETQA